MLRVRPRLLAVLSWLFIPITAFSQTTVGKPGRAAVMARVVRVDALPRVTPAAGGPVLMIPEGEVPMGDQAMEELKNAPGPNAASLPGLTIDPNAAGGAPAPVAPTAGIGFEGITQGRYIPSEPTAAVGPDQVFSPGNVTVTITNKDGSGRTEVDGGAFFGVPSNEGSISDAVCFYDALRGRYLALAFTRGTGSPNWSNFYLAISQSPDPRGAWYTYKFDQRYDGSTLSGNWSDFEGLGMSDDKIAMTSQQYSFSANSYQYQKVRVIDRALAYAGGPVPYADLYNFAAPAGGNVSNLFVTKAGRNLTAGDNTLHLFTVRYNGGSNVAYREVTGSPSTPVISAGSLINVSSYSAPPDAAQPGTTTLVPTNDCRTPEFIVRDGVMTVAWHTGVTFSGTTYAGIKLFRMRCSDRTVLTDETYAASGVFYYYPAVTVDSVGSIFLGFDRSSGTEYPSAWATGRRRTDATLEPSMLLKAGLASTTQTRWGDYTGIDLDVPGSGPTGGSAWYAGQWNKTATAFGTWVQKLTFTYGLVAGSVVEDCDGSSATTGDRTPLAGVSVALKQGTTTLATTASDAGGQWSFGYLETGVYDVVVTPPAGGTLVDAIAGSGGNGQSRVSASDVQVDLTNAQVSSANTFAVATPHAAPVANTIAPNTRSQGDSAFTLRVSGSGFLGCSVVRLDGADRPTTFVDATQLTAAILSSDIATSGTRTITVFTPAPGGGVSAGNPLTVNDTTSTAGVGASLPARVDLVAISPNPVTHGARITYALPRAMRVSLSVVDLQGRVVAWLAREEMPAGVHELSWSRGRVAAGVYFVRMEAGGRSFTRRMSVVK